MSDTTTKIRMLKSADVIAELNISNDTLYRMIADGRLTPMKLRREYRFEPDQVTALKRGVVFSASSKPRPRRRASVLMKNVKRRFSVA
jgi:excisionase family DNA binding protein